MEGSVGGILLILRSGQIRTFFPWPFVVSVRFFNATRVGEDIGDCNAHDDDSDDEENDNDDDDCNVDVVRVDTDCCSSSWSDLDIDIVFISKESLNGEGNDPMLGFIMDCCCC